MNNNQDDILMHYCCPHYKSHIYGLNPRYIPNKYQSTPVFFFFTTVCCQWCRSTVCTDQDQTAVLNSFQFLPWGHHQNGFYFQIFIWLIYSVFSHSIFLLRIVSVQMNHKHPCSSVRLGLITATHPISVGRNVYPFFLSFIFPLSVVYCEGELRYMHRLI